MKCAVSLKSDVTVYNLSEEKSYFMWCNNFCKCKA